MTSIWYEVFAVTVVSQQAMLIQTQQGGQHPTWMIAELAQIHPNESVVHHLASFFDNAFDSEHTVVHSTSWRYERASHHLLLTYLAVLPQGPWVNQLITVGRITVEPIRITEAVSGDHLFPPQKIGPDHALLHALDHLASLYTYDQAVHLALEPEWQAILSQRPPKPAGCLQKDTSLAVPPAAEAMEIHGVYS